MSPTRSSQFSVDWSASTLPSLAKVDAPPYIPPAQTRLTIRGYVRCSDPLNHERSHLRDVSAPGTPWRCYRCSPAVPR
jgi:hypothetical protein